MKKNRKIELLSPAGSYDAFIAAVQNGADAVYLGGELFNARMNAANFSREELKRAVSYAHIRGVRIFITFNTLIFDEEMEEALEYAGFLYSIGVDALIVQDYGLAAEIRRLYPDFELHLSTQATIASRRGVEAAAKLGFKRVVLARECSLEEIREACESGVEIEVFCHGALCICYSGQCQLSRARGKRSGNRGGCAQPCRLKYNHSGYPLSPKDLCLLPYLGELIEAGVCSLKIEGRMKSPEYVAIVTAAYRKYIDRYLESGPYRVERGDLERLMLSFNRGGFTEGYLFGNPGDKLMSGDIPKHQGLRIGRVTALPGRGIVELALDKGACLEPGDGFEIHVRDAEGELPGNIATYIAPGEEKTRQPASLRRSAGREAAEAEGARHILVGDIRKGYERISIGDTVFRTSSKALIEEARRSYLAGEKDGEKIYAERRKREVFASFTARIGEPARLRMCAGGTQAEAVSEALCEPTINKALSEERVREQLSKLGGTPFELKELVITMDEGLSLPASALNALRREAVEALSEKLGRTEGIRGLEEASSERGGCDERGRAESQRSEAGGEGPADSAAESEAAPGAGYALRVPAVTKGAFDSRLEAEYAEDAFARYAGKRVLCGSLAWLEPLIRAGAIVSAGEGLNITNEAARSLFLSLGAKDALNSPELSDELPKGALLMVSEHLLEGVLTDERGRSYLAKISPSGDKTLITLS